jgi:hypothetical protein
VSQDTITFMCSISLPLQFSVECWVNKDCSLFTLTISLMISNTADRCSTSDQLWLTGIA